jgi:hypothetical protein
VEGATGRVHREAGMVLFTIHQVPKRNFKSSHTLTASSNARAPLLTPHSSPLFSQHSPALLEIMGIAISKVLASILGKREMRKSYVLLGFHRSLNLVSCHPGILMVK